MRPAVLGILVLALAAGAQAPERVALRLHLQPGETLLWRESLRGEGELVRHGARPQSLPLEFLADGRRLWEVGDGEGDASVVKAISQEMRAVLRMPEATFEETEPWRSFRLWVDEHATLLGAEVVELATEDDEEADRAGAGMPIDIDLGEVFALVQVGLLPPGDLQVGERWRWPAEDGDETPDFAVEGRLADLTGADGAQVAELVTRLTSALPERDTPAPDVVMRGRLNAELRTWFDVAAGEVRRAAGPVDLVLSFERRESDRPVATVRLRLQLETEQIETKGRR